MFYKKIFIDLITYMDKTFKELPVDNVNALISYAVEWFPNYEDNKYLSVDDKAMIEGLFCD